MALFHRRSRLPFRTEPRYKAITVQFADHRLAAVPGHLRAVFMMDKMIEPKRKAGPAIARELHQLVKLVLVFRLPIGSKAHYFVLVAVFPKTQVLGNGRVKNAKRMGKGDRPSNVQHRTSSDSPHRAGKISESVDR